MFLQVRDDIVYFLDHHFAQAQLQCGICPTEVGQIPQRHCELKATVFSTRILRRTDAAK
jgi:hypothetical protein